MFGELQFDGTESIFHTIDSSKKCAFVDRITNVRQFVAGGASGIPCISDEEVLQRTIQEVKNDSDFIWAQFYDLATYYRSCMFFLDMECFETITKKKMCILKLI
jgi:hypothetical protein